MVGHKQHIGGLIEGNGVKVHCSVHCTAKCFMCGCNQEVSERLQAFEQCTSYESFLDLRKEYGLDK